ncbi:MAG: TlpA family protein disulfide reductase [Prevotella sp.]|nr:TlpA family protein disulfide reductase [Prevotella sp.]
MLANQADLTDYALRYIEVMRPVITDKQVKHCLLDNLVDRVVTQGNPKDVDRFWKPITDYAANDTELLNKYTPKIEALKKTRAGQLAPEQTFCDADGKSFKLSDLRGKVLYIDVWATWCVPCKNEIPHFAKVAEHYKDNPNILLISISTDREKDHDKWRKMIADEKPAWPQYVMKDAEHEKFSNDFNIQFIPRFIIINADGTIQNADAPRPSNKNIIHTLDEIIKKNAF